MKRIIIYIIMLLVYQSCEKTENLDSYEVLNISYKSTQEINSSISPDIIFYPNPFSSILYCNLPDETVQLTISDGKGKMKKIQTDNTRFALDFNDEPAGVYLCEVEIDGAVIREYLIKSE